MDTKGINKITKNKITKGKNKITKNKITKGKNKITKGKNKIIKGKNKITKNKITKGKNKITKNKITKGKKTKFKGKGGSVYLSLPKFKIKSLYNPIVNDGDKYESDYKIIQFLTGGLNEEEHNCIQTLKIINLDKNLIVTALDDDAYKYIKNLGVNVELKRTNLEKEANWGTKKFYEITYNKLEIIENQLKKNNKIIVYSDTDIVFLNDITEDIDKFKKSDYDVMFQNDVSNFDYNNDNNLCSGFMFFKPNNNCYRLLKDSMKLMKDNWNTDKLYAGGGADQEALNLSRKLNKNLKVGVLDLKEYPNGSRYFNNIDTIYKNYKPKIIHNNYIISTPKKVERFKKYNLWFINKPE